MQRLKLGRHGEVHNVLKELVEGDIEVFGRLQPRLYIALPVIQQQAEERGTLAIVIDSNSERLSLLQAAAAAASRGLALAPLGASSSSSSSSTYRQGLLCIARCCDVANAMVAGRVSSTSVTYDRRAQEEAAVAVQSTGAQIMC